MDRTPPAVRDRDPAKPMLVRMRLDAFFRFFGEICGPSILLQRLTAMIGEEGVGVIVPITEPDTSRLSRAVERQAGKRSDSDMAELRNYGTGAIILAQIGDGEMILLTVSHHIGRPRRLSPVDRRRARPIGGGN